MLLLRKWNAKLKPHVATQLELTLPTLSEDLA
jgi:hypothetical protein